MTLLSLSTVVGVCRLLDFSNITPNLHYEQANLPQARISDVWNYQRDDPSFGDGYELG
jgi:hypothetical protein